MLKAYQLIFLSEFQLQTVVQFQFQIVVVMLGLGNDRIRIEFFDLGRSLLRDNPFRNTDSVPFYLLPVPVAAEFQLGSVSEHNFVCDLEQIPVLLGESNFLILKMLRDESQYLLRQRFGTGGPVTYKIRKVIAQRTGGYERNDN